MFKYSHHKKKASRAKRGGGLARIVELQPWMIDYDSSQRQETRDELADVIKMTDGPDSRQTRVITLRAQGYTTREISSQINIAEGTVRNDINRIRKKREKCF